MIKRILAAVLAAALLVCCCSCSGGKVADGKILPRATHMAGRSTAEEVYAALVDAGLPGAGVFLDWVTDFAETVGNGDALPADEWVSPQELSADIFACMDAWEAKYDYSDANCRITAFTLLGDLLTAEKAEDSYGGTYLMFDIDAAENTEKYAAVKARLPLFTTLFGEKYLAPGESMREAFPAMWREYGFGISGDRISLISVVVSDVDGSSVFVGHTGVLVEQQDKLLFVEKIAFEQPYQATELNDTDELLALLAARPEYFGEAGEEGPFVYRNGELLGELESSTEN